MKISFDYSLRNSGKLIQTMKPLMLAANRSGYTLSIRYDLEEWVSARAKIDPNHSIVMPTFNPAVCDQNDSYWIEAKTHDGEVAAIIAARLFDTDDFIEDMSTGKVWADSPTHERLKLCLPDTFKMAGRVLYRGGLCVKRSHRKSGLSWILPRLVALISIDNGVDYIVSHNLADLHGSGFSFRVYGHTGGELCFDGTTFFPPTEDCRPAYFVWTDIDTALENARLDSELLIAGRDKNLSDLAILAQRPDEVQVAPLVSAG